METVSQILFSGLAQGAIYALLGLGFSIAGMATRLLNLAQGAYSLIGGFLFLTLVSSYGLPLVLALAVVLLLCLVMGVLTEKIVNARATPWLPVPHDIAILATLALLVAAEGAVFLIWGSDAHRGAPMQPGVFRLFGAIVPWQLVWIVGITLAIAILLHGFLKLTWTGRAMRACAQNPLMSYLLGIDVRKVGALAFAISAMIGATAGVLASPMTWVDYQMGGYFMLYGILAYLIGGEEEIFGPLAGGLLLGFLENIFLLIPGALGGLLKQVVPMLALILMLVLKPEGLLGSRRRAV